MKRQSTTAKLTAATVRLIAAAHARGEGVIIRFRGQEYGTMQLSDDRTTILCIAADGSQHLIKIVGRPAPTIRKATIDALHDAAVTTPADQPPLHVPSYGLSTMQTQDSPIKTYRYILSDGSQHEVTGTYAERLTWEDQYDNGPVWIETACEIDDEVFPAPPTDRHN